MFELGKVGMKEQFQCAAIQYDLPDGRIRERYGRRHHEIIKAIHDDGETEYYKKTHRDGFIIGLPWTARFVDRDEATRIAEEMGIKMKPLGSQKRWELR